MHVAIHAPRLSLPKCGIATYTKRLIRALSSVDGDNRYTIFSNCETSHEWDDLGPNFEIVRPGRLADSRWASVVWEQTALPGELARRRVDILHSMNMVSPVGTPCRSVVTYHDLTVLLFPELHSNLRRKFYALGIPPSLRRADAVICDSESTKRDLLRSFRIDPGLVHVVHIGVEDGVAEGSAGAESDVRTEHGLQGEYILYVGVLEPRKNLLRLVEAFARARRSSEDVPPKLVIAGQKGWQYDEIFALAKGMKIEGEIVFTGAVPDDDLEALYAGARAFAYPSLYEGFGLPVLEAMARGVPVVTSNVSSLPEVAGDAAVLADPYDPADIARGLVEICSDSGLRSRLAKRGLDRARAFTWDKTARATLDVYRLCVRNAGMAAQ
jgi:glycosyltransferase involved in cell wall biosynthesis